MTLTEFLLARITDDETRARILAETRRNVWGAEMWDGADSPYPDYPPRILDDCYAKRRIVESCVESQYGWILRELASPYADHPDYLAEWSRD